MDFCLESDEYLSILLVYGRSFFKKHPHPDENQRLQLSRELGLDPKQIKFWFQNKRTQKKVLSLSLLEKLYFQNTILTDDFFCAVGSEWENRQQRPPGRKRENPMRESGDERGSQKHHLPYLSRSTSSRPRHTPRSAQTQNRKHEIERTGQSCLPSNVSFLNFKISYFFL